jgi:hypothetical protein
LDYHGFERGSCTSSVYSQNFDASYATVSGALRSLPSRSTSPNKSINSKLIAPTPIMERTRAAYRLGDHERPPLRSLGTNERVGGKQMNTKRKKREKGMAKLVGIVKSQRPLTIDGRNGIGSLKGETIPGNEAFI